MAACGAYIPVAGSYPLYCSAALPIVDSLTPEDWEDLQKRFVGVTGEFRNVPNLKSCLAVKIYAEDKVNEEHTRHTPYLASVVVSVWLLTVTPASTIGPSPFSANLPPVYIKWGVGVQVANYDTGKIALFHGHAADSYHVLQVTLAKGAGSGPDRAVVQTAMEWCRSTGMSETDRSTTTELGTPAAHSPVCPSLPIPPTAHSRACPHPPCPQPSLPHPP